MSTINHRILTPAEARNNSEAQEPRLKLVRERLNQAIQRNGGRSFTVAAELIPTELLNAIYKELHENGWNIRLVPDSRDGDYYSISPAR